MQSLGYVSGTEVWVEVGHLNRRMNKNAVIFYCYEQWLCMLKDFGVNCSFEGITILLWKTK